MTPEEKEGYKTHFKTNLDLFAKDLQKYVSTENGDWTVKGFIDAYKNIYTISSDTKIVSKILEIHIFPQILHFAEGIDYKIVLAEKQNWYPDLTFVNKADEGVKFALDIKTTFRRNTKTAGFTLGSHGAYFKERDKKKNIQFPYSQYSGHYCLGVIYTRTDFTEFPDTEIFQVKELQEEGEQHPKAIGERKVTTVDNLKSITSVIKDFEFFAAEKWKIASDGQGSGNTANIGSITDIEDLRSGNGIFSKLGEQWFDEYWMNYGTATMVKDGKTVKITNIKDYLEYKNKADLWDSIVKKVSRKNSPQQKEIEYDESDSPAD